MLCPGFQMAGYDYAGENYNTGTENPEGSHQGHVHSLKWHASMKIQNIPGLTTDS